MWVLIDNYDSFTYILQHYLLQALAYAERAGEQCLVYRNDQITIAELEQLNPDRIIVSPGPETPLKAGISMEVIAQFHKKIPLLGICLGHQAIGMHFGAPLLHAPYPMHGKTSLVHHEGHPLFRGIDQSFTAMRYHSLAIGDLEGTGLLNIAQATDDGTVMAVQHQQYPCIGIQFHPESVGTTAGLQILRNWALMYEHDGA